jgi:allophanate hydrolase
VTLIAQVGRDGLLAAEGARLSDERALPPAEVGPDETILAVCGAHMSGLPLNDALTSRGARFLREARTAEGYRLFALPGGPPERPGLVRDADGAGRIGLELWALPKAEVGSFLGTVPSPLAIGTIRLEDGGGAQGFLCETAGTVGATDITAHGGWRAWLEQRHTADA